MKTFLTSVIASVALISGCGAPKANQADQTTNPAALLKNATVPGSQPASLNANLPAGAIVRVPLDAAGQAISSLAELRVLPVGTTPTINDPQAATAAFANASAPARVGDELDQDSSSQSWLWRRNNYYYGSYYGGYGYNNWYSPSYNYYGSYYYYGSPYYCNYGGYGYYYYPRTYNYYYY